MLFLIEKFIRNLKHHTDSSCGYSSSFFKEGYGREDENPAMQ